MLGEISLGESSTRDVGIETEGFRTNIVNDGSNDDTNGESDFHIREVFASIGQTYRDDIPGEVSKYQTPIPDDEDIIQRIEDIIEYMPQETNTEKSVTSCVKCCKSRRAKYASSFKIGQHIRLPGEHSTTNCGRRLLKVYYHHAIVKNVTTSGSEDEVVLNLIHFARVERRIKIYEAEKHFDLKNDEIDIIDYMRPRYDPETIVKRAESIVPNDTMSKEHRKFSSYNLLACNCEHFATWCVVGKRESLQVGRFLKYLQNGLNNVAGVGSYICRFASLDKLMDAKIDLGQLCSGVLLGAGAGFYLVYTIAMTLYYRRKYSKGNLCKVCMKRKLISLWSSFGAFCVISGLSYLIVNLLLPLLVSTPAAVIPLLLVVIVLSLALQWGIKKVVQALMAQYACDKIVLRSFEQITPGSLITYDYYGFKHYAIVTDISEQSVIKYVHYGLAGLTREVIEEEIRLDIKRNSINLQLLDCRHISSFSPEMIIERARARVGERKWRPFGNRSDHLCFYSIVKEHIHEFNGTPQQNTSELSSERKRKCSLYIGRKEIHLKSDLQIGHIVKYNGQSGILVDLEKGGGEQTFEMELMVFLRIPRCRVTRRKYSVNLRKKKLFIKECHPAHCCPFEERVSRALKCEGKITPFWTRTGFIESCFLKTSKFV